MGRVKPAQTLATALGGLKMGGKGSPVCLPFRLFSCIFFLYEENEFEKRPVERGRCVCVMWGFVKYPVLFCCGVVDDHMFMYAFCSSSLASACKVPVTKIVFSLLISKEWTRISSGDTLCQMSLAAVV